MIQTRICTILGIEHPIALGGMPTLFNSAELVAAVCEAGGIGMLGCTFLAPERIQGCVEDIRALTGRPFGLNFLMFKDDEAGYEAALDARPSVISLAWPRKDQDLAVWVARAHEADCKVVFMAAEVAEAVRGAEAGADIIVAQGTEGGGHVGWMATSVLLPMVVDAVAPVPVMAAGGIADGRGLAAALCLGAEGVLLGTRFLASKECGLHANFKNAIIESDGHDTVLTEIPDIAARQNWPGAMSRVGRNRFIERWAGREWALRSQVAEAADSVAAARKRGDASEAPLFFGQDAGLITDLPPAAEIIARTVAEAEALISARLPGLLQEKQSS